MKVNKSAFNVNNKKCSLPTKLLKPKSFKSNKTKAKPLKEMSLGQRNKVESVKSKVELKPKSLSNIKRDLLKNILKEKGSLASMVKVDPNTGKTKIKRNLVQIRPKPFSNDSTKIHVTSPKVANRKQMKNGSEPEKFTRSKTPSKVSKNVTEEKKSNKSQSKRKNMKNRGSKAKMSENVIRSMKTNPGNGDDKKLCKLQLNKVSSTVNSLFKILKEKSQNKPELLDLEEPIFLQVECIKIPTCSTKQLRFKLPHPLFNELSDVLLITADKKGAKIHPDRAVEHYTDLLDKHNIKFIQKVMPLRMLRQEYTQYEMKRKLVDQFDAILADANVLSSLPKILGGFALFSKKMPIPVHLDKTDLKQHLQNALSKTQMTVKSKGNTSIVQVGHTKMAAGEVAANILEVSECLNQGYPGGWPNVRSLHIKTATSTTQAVYISLVSPNDVKLPVEKVKKLLPIEDELSTYPDMVVVVKPDGNVFLKKPEKEIPQLDTQFDDELIQAAQKYIQASKTVRYDSEEEDNDAVEEDFLKNYEAAKRANAVDSDEENGNEEAEEEEEEDEEEEEESDDEEPVLPPVTTTKKRKMEPVKKQAAVKLPNKKQKLDNDSQKEKKPNANKQGPVGKPQKRGARGGKKNKMSKDQRKALIKRKKAGKK